MSTRIIPYRLFLNTGVAVVSAQSLGVFGTTGQLTTARSAHTATLLPNGKVLVAGGWATLAGWPVWSSAELYDPSMHTFALTGAMAVPRFEHTATLLPTGKVLIAGGSSVVNGNSSLASTELYDPSTGTFTAASNMTTARFFHTATLLNNGKVLMTGGYGSGADGTLISLPSAELYDPLLGTFEPAGNITAGGLHTATLLANGKVLIQGVIAAIAAPSQTRSCMTLRPGLSVSRVRPLTPVSVPRPQPRSRVGWS
jgi:hypothetical protein